MSHVCFAAHYKPLVGLTLNVPPEHMKQALENPDAILVALQLGRLDVVTLLLAIFGIGVAVLGLIGYSSVKSGAREVAKEAARLSAREAASEFLRSKESKSMLEEVFQNPALLARIQVLIVEAGIENTSKAAFVDEDPDYAPATAPGG